jgi:hypothetical protein
MVDVLLVGRGIAGVSFAYQLAKAGKSFCIYDDNLNKSATKKAMGTWNPVVIKDLKTTWPGDEKNDLAHVFFTELEKLFGAKFYTPIQILRPIPTESYQKMWLQNQDEGTQKFIQKPIYFSIQKEAFLQTAFGIGAIEGGGYVNPTLFLEASEKYFTNQNILFNECFDYSKIEFFGEHFKYNNTEYQKIIFCQGASLIQNPFFGDVGFNLCKGEWIKAKSKVNLENTMIKTSTTLFFTQNGNFLAGGTYDWDSLEEELSEIALSKIQKNLSKIKFEDYNIEERVVGIRPSTFDRRPFLGAHGNHKNMYVYCGLGSRGFQVAPYISNLLFQHIFESQELPQELHWNRKSLTRKEIYKASLD